MRCTPLTVEQHLLCVVIGAFALVAGYFVKYIPVHYFESFSLNEEALGQPDEERAQSFRTSLRKSRSLSRSYS